MDKPAENNHNTALRPARIFTLGCRLNQADTALLTDRLRQLGYYVQNPGEKSAPELVIVNSCAVTAAAAAKSRQAARKFQQLYPECRIVFTGCAAEINITARKIGSRYRRQGCRVRCIITVLNG